MDCIWLKNLNHIECNLDTEHMESIVAEKNIQGCNYGSFQIEICLKRKSGYSTQVRVNDAANVIKFSRSNTQNDTAIRITDEHQSMSSPFEK